MEVRERYDLFGGATCLHLPSVGVFAASACLVFLGASAVRVCLYLYLYLYRWVPLFVRGHRARAALGDVKPPLCSDAPCGRPAGLWWLALFSFSGLFVSGCSPDSLRVFCFSSLRAIYQ